MSSYITTSRSSKEIFATILFVKVSIFLLIILAYYLLPFNKLYYYSNFIFHPHSPIFLQTAFSTWDAQHYLYLSEQGFHHGNNDSNAFAPLFPFFIYLVNFFIKNSFISGIFLANLFSFIGFYYFYKLVTKISSEDSAYKSLLFLLAFPTSFYFSLIYTESLFFLLVILFFSFLQKKQVFLASIMAFFMPLARTIGIAIFFPFLSSFVLEIQQHTFSDEVKSVAKSFFQKKALLLLSPLIGFLVLLGFMYFATRDPFSQFNAQKDFLANHSFLAIINLSVLVKQFFAFPLVLHGYTNSVLDRLFFLGFLAFLPFLWKRVSHTFFLYAIVFGLLPVLSGSFMSYMRYLLIIFPLFIALGKMSLEKKYHTYTFPFLFASIMLQSLFIIMHALNYWVS